MKPISLTMQAFGSYGAKTTIDFEKPAQNLFLISGDTGSGKSTIFDAIVFALYGEASSESNRKSGAELQSQFVGLDTDPYVELTFSEQEGGEEQTYTVHRVPKHLRLLKRKSSTGKNVKEDAETVSLTLPDGSEYSAGIKETNAKLEEIIHLTKSQFMQVAMIAQGEFMASLRAKTAEKKETFRKLFHTEIYQELVDRLEEKKKAKKAEIDRFKVFFQTEVAHIEIPEAYKAAGADRPGEVSGADKVYAAAEELESIKRRIRSAKEISVVDMEAITNLLPGLCEFLQKQKTDAEGQLRIADEDRTTAKTALEKAELLMKAFSSYENAQKELEECEKLQQAMNEKEQLRRQILSSYEIQAAYHRFADTRDKLDATIEKQQKQQILLPQLTEDFTGKAEKEQIAKKALDQENSIYGEVSQKVADARSNFRRTRQEKRNLQTLENTVIVRQQEAEAKKQELDAFDRQVILWRNEETRLSQTDTLLLQWQHGMENCEKMGKAAEDCQNQLNAVARQQRTAKQTADDYRKTRSAFERKNNEYQTKRQQYLDAQAGFLAKESLKENQPCPVCGSIHHPAPCILADEFQNLTRQMIDNLAAETAGLEQKQSEAALAANTANTTLDEKKQQLEEKWENLQTQVRTVIFASEEKKPAEETGALRSEGIAPEGIAPGIPTDQEITSNGGIPIHQEITSLPEASALIENYRSKLLRQEKSLKADQQSLRKIRKALESSDTRRSQLQEAYEAARAEGEKANAECVRVRGILSSLEASRTYRTEEEALQVLAEAEKKQQQARTAHDQALYFYQKAKSAKESAENTIHNCAEEIPGLSQQKNYLENAYQTLMDQYDLTENEWKDTVSKYPKSHAEELRKQKAAFENRKSSAQGAMNAAEKTIGGQKKPDLDQLKAEEQASQTRYEEQKKKADTVRTCYLGNRRILDELSPKLEERRQMVADYNRIDGLYSRLSGKISGSRMDLETYVQRYYLQHMLNSANTRFLEMSAGQYELRLVSQEDAGDGKNRGLDLMVYSNVTGKERAVNTLSGGESFIAALSLALGMADQIQAATSAIHLDIMFIDEGFGSLDEHSRETAVRVLKTMADGEKLIGIISHVSELKQEIDDQLLVTKDENGSHIRWQLS